MKLLYFLYDHTGNGGTERIISKKCNAFIERGYEVTIVDICQSDRVPKFAYSEKIKFENLNLNFTRIREFNLLIKIILYPVFNQLLKRKIAKIIRKADPDITISTFNYEVKFVPYVKHRSKKVLEFHHNRGYKSVDVEKREVSSIQKFIINRKEKSEDKIISLYDRFIVLTENDKEAWGNPGNCLVIPNMLPFTSNTQADLSQKSALSIGRLTYLKGFDRLIETWKIVYQNHPDWKLSIVGEGEEFDHLQNQINDLELNQNVTIYPFTHDVIKYYISHSFYICSSRQEGFGLTLIEAMECGLPCVSFDCSSGPAEIIDDQHDGFLVDNNDVNQLSLKINELISNEKLRRLMGKNAKISAKRYSEEMIIGKWTSLFESFF